jgi:hypothetical protein
VGSWKITLTASQRHSVVLAGLHSNMVLSGTADWPAHAEQVQLAAAGVTHLLAAPEARPPTRAVLCAFMSLAMSRQATGS